MPNYLKLLSFSLDQARSDKGIIRILSWLRTRNLAHNTLIVRDRRNIKRGDPADNSPSPDKVSADTSSPDPEAENDTCPLFDELTSPAMREVAKGPTIERWVAITTRAADKPDLDDIKGKVIAGLNQAGIKLEIERAVIIDEKHRYEYFEPLGIILSDFHEIDLDTRSKMGLKEPPMREAKLYIDQSLTGADYESTLYQGLLRANFDLKARSERVHFEVTADKLGLNYGETAFLRALCRDFSIASYTHCNRFATEYDQLQHLTLMKVLSEFLGPNGQNFESSMPKAPHRLGASEEVDISTQARGEIKTVPRDDVWHTNLINALGAYCSKVHENIETVMIKLGSDEVRLIELQVIGGLMLILDKHIFPPEADPNPNAS